MELETVVLDEKDGYKLVLYLYKFFKPNHVVASDIDAKIMALQIFHEVLGAGDQSMLRQANDPASKGILEIMIIKDHHYFILSREKV